MVVVPKEPYLAWARSLEGCSPIDEMSNEDLTSVYLVSADVDDLDRDAIVQQHWSAIFDEQLHSWSMDRRTWPRVRNLTMFLDWFDVRVVELVYDLGDGIVDHDE